MGIRLGRSVVAFAALPALLLGGCSGSDSDLLHADDTPRSIGCQAIPFKNAIVQQKAKDAPQGVQSVDLVTNSPEQVVFDIVLTGTPNSDTKLTLDIATNSSDSPGLPAATNGLYLRSDTAEIYSIVLRSSGGFDVAEFYYEGNSPKGFNWSDVDSFITVETKADALQVSLNPANLPELPAGKNFGYSLVLENSTYLKEGCSDAVPS